MWNIAQSRRSVGARGPVEAEATALRALLRHRRGHTCESLVAWVEQRCRRREVPRARAYGRFFN